jgi:hypothetical protein
MEKKLKHLQSFEQNIDENLNRGEIRKKADYLLGILGAAYLRNIGDDNREEIKQRLSDIEKSGIDWDKDVIKSVREKYKDLTSDETVNLHMNRW